MEGWGRVLQKIGYVLNQHPIYGMFSPIARIHRSRNQGVEKRVVSFTITPSDQLDTFCFLLLEPFPGPEVLFKTVCVRVGASAQRHNQHSTELEAQTSCFGFLMPLTDS